MKQHQPDRLNLAIARRCFVACKGCYSYFGKHEPDLLAFAKTVEMFVHLGILDVTISGGDPLTIEGLVDFLKVIRSEGVRTIKIDTVGTGFFFKKQAASIDTSRLDRDFLDDVIKNINYLGIPLDGWSNDSVKFFRKGRPFLYDETVGLLNTIDALAIPPGVIINTVMHKHNLYGLEFILKEVIRHRSICHWNIFQYTPTDQAVKYVNEDFQISDKHFLDACNTLQQSLEHALLPENLRQIDFRSITSRLGKYLLINSDGHAWIPDKQGKSIHLGSVFGREELVLESWSATINNLIHDTDALTCSSHIQNLVYNEVFGGATGI